MGDENVQLTVYGAEVRCASCVNSPGSKETYEWLQAAISRKYGDQGVTFHYFDIHKHIEEADQNLIEQIHNDELFYPLVVIEGNIVGEGNPRLKKVYQALESHGLQKVSGSE